MDRFSKKKKGKKRVFLALIGLVGGGVMVFGYLFFTPYGDGEKKEFQLTRGLSARQVAQFLKRADIIRSEFLFRLWVSLTSTSTKLQPGRYTIPGEISVADLTEILAPPGTTGQVRITIPEGKTRKEIGEILDRREIVPKKLWLLVEPRDFPEYPFLIGKESLEGFLFPDTYFTRRGMPPREVTDVLLKNFSIKAWPLLKGRTDYYEVLTVASIVEAEENER